MASAVVPVNGNGDKYQSWCLARYARVSNALILQSPTNNKRRCCTVVDLVPSVQEKDHLLLPRELWLHLCSTVRTVMGLILSDMVPVPKASNATGAVRSRAKA